MCLSETYSRVPIGQFLLDEFPIHCGLKQGDALSPLLFNFALEYAISLLSKNLKVRIYKTVILPVVLHGCESWTFTLREEHRLRVFENKVLRKIFGSKRDEVTGEWRKLHNTELHALYSSPDVIRDIKSRRLRWAGHVARMGESRNAYRVLVGPEGKRPLGRPRRRWEDNIKLDLREVGYDDREWINLAQDRDQWRAYVRAAMNLRLCFYGTVRRTAENCRTLFLSGHNANVERAFSLMDTQWTGEENKLLLKSKNAWKERQEQLLGIRRRWRRRNNDDEVQKKEERDKIKEKKVNGNIFKRNLRGGGDDNDDDDDDDDDDDIQNFVTLSLKFSTNTGRTTLRASGLSWLKASRRNQLLRLENVQ
ncbi:hypothetical protein ANN_16253 [Periplaneta americana]|uniref:Reverse transcriptase domain-containing protein n=1 Tax=Periplaneta americana TaxID=6978 RepID=A0ABQ8SIG7_PERAM|nr:hypothetical protein ANN_16253 [Periplaneta americana]